MRLELRPGNQIDCAESADDQPGVTLKVGIQRHNCAEVSAEEPLAWLGEKGLSALQLLDGQGEDVVSQFFEERNGLLCPSRQLKLFMVTENPRIASSDCLFYVVAAD